ncbi:MAG: AmmeMemoRadiSam system protein A [Gemmatimonadetes bacterium]|nr:AmmeMemoRadiSam system protein A [Gemmatimonadota bacterium]
MIPPEDRRTLLRIAEQAVACALRGETYEPETPGEGALLERRGAFVTLERNSLLRGCIGRIASDEPLYALIPLMARDAAFRDPRFPPVTEEELPQLSFEISALGPARTIADPEEIRLGIDGLIVRHGSRTGLLLPQVATTFGWTKRQFLEETCEKAGLAPAMWKETATVEAFEAEVWRS